MKKPAKQVIFRFGAEAVQLCNRLDHQIPSKNRLQPLGESGHQLRHTGLDADPVDLVPPGFQLFCTHLDELLETMNLQKQFNGTVLLAENGKIVYEKSIGTANFNDGRKLSPESSFQLASASKQFTAMGIMLLQEQVKLELPERDDRRWRMIESESGVVQRVQHGGSWVGFRTSITRDLENKRTTIVLTNHSSNHLGMILEAIGSIRNEIPVNPPGQDSPATGAWCP